MRVAILNRDIRLPAKEIHRPRGSELFLRRTRNNPINQGSPAGAITSHGCETRREPNPSRKYCPPRRRNIFSGVCFFFSPRLFSRWSHDPEHNQGSSCTLRRTGLSMMSVHLPLSPAQPPFPPHLRPVPRFLQIRRVLFAFGRELRCIVQPWEPTARVRLSGGLIATERSVNS